MSDDITKVLEKWDYRLGRVDARRVMGEDGVEKLQLRIDLGLLQMNAQFRPDGKRPFGHPTLLDHFLIRLEKHRKENGGEDDNFQINPDECAKLQQEAIQYHHRSICNFELADYEAVERDTEHILELLDFVQDFAPEEEIGQSFQQFRPQTIMLQIRAIGTELIAASNYDAAINEINNASDNYTLYKVEEGVRSFYNTAVLSGLAEPEKYKVRVKFFVNSEGVRRNSITLLEPKNPSDRHMISFYAAKNAIIKALTDKTNYISREKYPSGINIILNFTPSLGVGYD